MKFNFFIFLLTCSSCWFLSSCDSGDIYPKEEKPTGISVNANFRFQNVGAFPSADYEIYIGVFDQGSTIPLTSKTISKPQENNSVNISLDNIPKDAAFVRLCLAQADKRIIHTFYETAANLTSPNKITIPEQEINLLEYNRIQQQAFKQCIACHGGSSTAAGSLYLTADSSYIQLVNVQSQKSTKKRIEPFNVENSFLVDVLTKSKDEVGLTYPHNTGLSSLKKEDITLIEEWVKNGAMKYK